MLEVWATYRLVLVASVTDSKALRGLEGHKAQ